jgi:uncharacterized protein YecT (DUF1311 family)
MSTVKDSCAFVRTAERLSKVVVQRAWDALREAECEEIFVRLHSIQHNMIC